MERKISDRFLEWKNNHVKTALVVSGARQVGKTYSIREFAEKNYRASLYINFEDDPGKCSLFGNGTSADILYERLSYDFDITDFDGCALILDEIQLCPLAVSALKPLAIDGRCDIIASGSLLGNTNYDGIITPMGYTDTIIMEPMDFEEFLWALGISRKQTERIGDHIRNKVPLDDYILKKLNDLFKRYIVVGGMPDAVRTYAETQNYAQASQVHARIYDKMCDDAKKYALFKKDKMRIQECLDSIPRQLSNEKKTFNYSDILMRRGYGKREYGSALLWLKNAGIIDFCFNLEEPVEPLRIKSRSDSFRVYMKDTGILTYMLGPGIAAGIVDGDFYVNNGAIMENVIAESLVKKGFDIFFYLREKRKNPDGTVRTDGMELDFVINLNGDVTAIEVKSGNKRQSKSLNRAISGEYKINRAIKLAEGNIMTDQFGVEHYPLFAVSFMDDASPPDLGPMDYLDDLSDALDRDVPPS